MSVLRIVGRTTKWVVALAATVAGISIMYSAFLIYTFDTESLPEGFGSVNTELFLGDGENQPLIVGFGGAEGGNAWASDYWKPQRDRFLDQGYAFMALAYFGEAGIPRELDRISLDGVHDAIMKATDNPKINRECIAIIGGSKGAELALLLASYFPEIKAVSAIVPGHAIFAGQTVAMNTSSWSINSEQLPFIPVPWSALPAILLGDLRSAWEKMLEDEISLQNAAISVENINGPIFLLSATQDELWPSTEMSQSIVVRLQRNNFVHKYQHVAIEGSHTAPQAQFFLVEEFLNNYFLPENEIGCPR